MLEVIVGLSTVANLALRISAIGAVVAVAAAIAWRRRRAPAAPTQPRGAVPAQLNRADFDQPATPWLVVAFTSATCLTCADIARKAGVLASRDVAVQEVEFAGHRALHDRYRIDAVPTLVIADSRGVVQFGHLGPLSATDLWAAMARCRDPQLLQGECTAPTV